jgi:hypothetical protein
LIEEFQNAPRRPPGVDRGFDGLERFGQPSRWIVSETTAASGKGRDAIRPLSVDAKCNRY